MANKHTTELVRVTTAGSVDDGKSTLIGRLLFATGSVFQDQLDSVLDASRRQGKTEPDYSLLVDGLAAEREQGITIDVAYRYLATARRRYVIADVPGHEQYTRNMVSGASLADVAVILVDATKGLLPQTKRHLCIATLLGIRHVLVAVNKMDQAGYSEKTFRAISDSCRDFAAKLRIADLQFIPLCALTGEMVVERGSNLLWWRGFTLLDYLENLYIGSDRNLIDFRFPVQLVQRDAERRYLGTIASGTLSVNDEVIVLPSKQRSLVTAIGNPDGQTQKAESGEAIAILLADHLDVSRGTMIVRPGNVPIVSTAFEAVICWLGTEPLKPNTSYLIKHTTLTTRATITELRYELNTEDLHRRAADQLQTNELGVCRLTTTEPVCFDPYEKNRTTGSFIIIDELTKATVAAGIIRGVTNPENELASTL